MPWPVLAATAQSYTTRSASTTSGWRQSGLSIEASSLVSALNRIYPQSGAAPLNDLGFIWEINSAAPWAVGTGTPVYIKSTITVGV